MATVRNLAPLCRTFAASPFCGLPIREIEANLVASKAMAITVIEKEQGHQNTSPSAETGSQPGSFVSCILTG